MRTFVGMVNSFSECNYNKLGLVEHRFWGFLAVGYFNDEGFGESWTMEKAWRAIVGRPQAPYMCVPMDVHYSTIAHILSIIPLPPCVGRIACGVWGWSVAGVSRTPVYHLFHAFFSLTP